MKIQGRVVVGAKESRDRNFRKLATGVWQRIRTFLDKPNFQESPYWFNYSREDGFYLGLGWISPKYKNLVVVFTPKGFIKGGFGNMGTKKVIVMAILIGKNDTKHLATRFNKDLFVHEFIHALDDKRYGGRMSMDGAKVLDNQGEAAYYNTSGEFNAYYQEGANAVVRLLTGEHGDKVFNLSNFHTFQPQATKLFDKDWVTALNPINRKKFLKRLAGLFDYYRR